MAKWLWSGRGCGNIAPAKMESFTDKTVGGEHWQAGESSCTDRGNIVITRAVSWPGLDPLALDTGHQWSGDTGGDNNITPQKVTVLALVKYT